MRKNLLQRKSYQELVDKKRKDVGYRVGRMVTEARIIKNLTQEELAEKTRTSQSAIARLESGKSVPSLRVLVKLAKAINTYLIPPKFAFMEEIEKEHDLSAKERLSKLNDSASVFQFNNFVLAAEQKEIVGGNLESLPGFSFSPDNYSLAACNYQES